MVNVKSYEDKVIDRNRKSIFLAGPTPRSRDVESWRPAAIEYLNSIECDCDVFVPETEDNNYNNLSQSEYESNVNWELEHLDKATVIVFWVPRDLKDMPALTTNVEFGYHLKTGRVVYGRPPESVKNRYLDYLYKQQYGKEPCETLEDTLAQAIKMFGEQKIYFTSDTHFGSNRTLELLRRPFESVEEMDNAMIEKWNAKVTPNDIVCHIGDFGNFDVLDKLKGKVVLILGNYEKEDMKDNYNNDFQAYRSALIAKGFLDVVQDGLTIKINDENVYLTHEPLNCKKNCFNLFGHVHKGCMCKSFGLNVGVDCFDYNPATLDDVLFFKNAIENHYDGNIFCTVDDLKDE